MPKLWVSSITDIIGALKLAPNIDWYRLGSMLASALAAVVPVVDVPLSSAATAASRESSCDDPVVAVELAVASVEALVKPAVVLDVAPPTWEVPVALAFCSAP